MQIDPVGVVFGKNPINDALPHAYRASIVDAGALTVDADHQNGLEGAEHTSP